MKKSMLFLVLFFANMLLVWADVEHAHDNHHKPKHGGKILEVGDHEAHLEVVHDQVKGTIKIFVMDKNHKDKKISEAPKLNIYYKADGKEQKKQVSSTFAEADQKESHIFVATDDAFKTKDFKGKIAIKIDDKSFQVDLDQSNHDHDH